MRDGTTTTLLFGEIGRYNGTRAFQGLWVRNIDPAMFTTPQSTCADAVGDTQNPGFYKSAYGIGGGDKDLDSGRSRGTWWAMGSPVMTGFYTILPPNGPSCGLTTTNHGNGQGMFTAGSYHSGGIQVALCDGSVKFISETIDTGNLNAANPTAGKSPYGVWGALGTRGSGELIDGNSF